MRELQLEVQGKMSKTTPFYVPQHHEALVVYGNDNLWSTEEREAIIDCAVKIYLEWVGCRKASLPAPPVKRQRVDDEGSYQGGVIRATKSDFKAC
jgi:hypothetical protein